MNKQQFMGELKQLLGDIPAVERDEALNYYEDYFADAGEENEAAIIEQLQSPEKVAYTIKSGLADEDGSTGEFTEHGFKGYEDDSKDELINTISDTQNRGFGIKGANGRNNILLIIIVLILLSPIILPVLGSVFGICVGIFAAAFGIIFVVAVAGVALVVAGALALIVGIANISTALMGSFVVIGVALILLGIGSITVTVGTKIITKLLPAVFNAIVEIGKNLVGTINRKRGIV